MSLLVFVLIVLLVAVLVMWAVYYIPLPPGAPTWARNVAYLLILIIAILIILSRAGFLAAAAQTPTPIKPAPAGAAYERSRARSMFLSDRAPRSSNVAFSRPATASRTLREITMPPGGA